MKSTEAILIAFLSLHLLSSAIATDPLLLNVYPVQSSGGLTHFVANAAASSKGFNLSLDTSSSELSIPSSECAGHSKVAFTFSSVQQNDFFPGGPVEVANLSVVCTDKNILGLSSGPSSMASQLWSRTRIRKTFAYCLSSSAVGQLAFGRTFYHVFRDTDVLQARTATLVHIPVNVQSTGAYQLELTRIGVGRSGFLFKLVDTKIQVGTASRYTSLPAPAYQALRTRIESIAASRRIAKLPTSFGELDLCYKMSSSQLKSFPNITMEFSSKAAWTVSPNNYLLQKPDRREAVCLAIKPASSTSPAVIGTFQQEDNWVEYDLGNNTVGVSGSLTAQFDLGCGNTHGS